MKAKGAAGWNCPATLPALGRPGKSGVGRMPPPAGAQWESIGAIR
jgi:hypothetical protein